MQPRANVPAVPRIPAPVQCSCRFGLRTAAFTMFGASETMPLTLVSHALCPYVQRAAIVLAEKGVAFTRRDVDLANKPDWFLAVSPLGKTPVLMVDDVSLFESAVICDYLDDTLPPRMHPTDALMRARHRAWVAFSSELLRLIGTLYSAADEAALLARSDEL